MSKRKALSKDERAEKQRFKDAFDAAKPAWEEKNGEALTQEKLAQIAGMSIKGEPYSQGMVWQYLTPTQDTRMPVKFVQFVAALLNFDPSMVGDSYAIPQYLARISFPSLLGAPRATASVSPPGGAEIADDAEGMTPEEFTALVERYAPHADLTQEQRLRIVSAVVGSSSGRGP